MLKKRCIYFRGYSRYLCSRLTIPLFAGKWSVASRDFKRRPLIGRINVVPSELRSSKPDSNFQIFIAENTFSGLAGVIVEYVTSLEAALGLF